MELGDMTVDHNERNVVYTLSHACNTMAATWPMAPLCVIQLPQDQRTMNRHGHRKTLTTIWERTIHSPSQDKMKANFYRAVVVWSYAHRKIILCTPTFAAYIGQTWEGVCWQQSWPPSKMTLAQWVVLWSENGLFNYRPQKSDMAKCPQTLKPNGHINAVCVCFHVPNWHYPSTVYEYMFIYKNMTNVNVL